MTPRVKAQYYCWEHGERWASVYSNALSEQHSTNQPLFITTLLDSFGITQKGK
jgi:hypothetical protein